MTATATATDVKVSANRAVPDQKILVTGGHGYIGRAISRAHTRVCSDAQIIPVDIVGPDPLDMRDSRFAALVDEIRPSTIVHLAGISWAPEHDDIDELIWSTNMELTERLIDIAVEYRVRRVVLASSAAVFEGHTGGFEGIPEPATVSSEPAPISGYARSKADSETLLAAAEGGFELVIVRAGTVCGIDDPRARIDLVVNRMCVDAIQTGKIQVTGEGLHYRPLATLDQVANCYLRRALHGGRPIEHVVNGHASIIEIAEAVAAATDATIEHRHGGGERVRDYMLEATWPQHGRLDLGRIVAQVLHGARKHGPWATGDPRQARLDEIKARHAPQVSSIPWESKSPLTDLIDRELESLRSIAEIERDIVGDASGIPGGIQPGTDAGPPWQDWLMPDPHDQDQYARWRSAHADLEQAFRPARPDPAGMVLEWFAHDHLPRGRSRLAAAHVAMLADSIDRLLDDDPEKTAGLRKLLEAKDCFVRAAIRQTRNTETTTRED